MLSILLVFCVSLDVIRELCFKLAARANGTSLLRWSADSLLPHLTLRSLWTLIGALSWGIGILAWVQVLARLPLNVALPIISLTYATTPVAAWLLLGERIHVRRWVGIAFVTAGVAVVASTGIG